MKMLTQIFNIRLSVFKLTALFISQLLTFFFITSCGAKNLFRSANSPTDLKSPTISATVVPPVPVIGSYLTMIVLDEASNPLPDVTVVSSDKSFLTKTDAKGLATLPLAAVQTEHLDVDFAKGGQTLPARLYLPPDLIDKLKTVSSSSAGSFSRALAILLPDNLKLPPQSPVFDQVQRLPVVTMSLPIEITSTVLTSVPVFKLELQSPRNIDVVTNPVLMNGACTSGFKIRLKGDVAENQETTCVDSGGQGQFSMNFSLTGMSGYKQVVLEQVEPNSGVYVSLLFTVFADLSSIPTAVFLSPTKTDIFSPNTNVSISWMCSSVTGLDPAPARISFTSDDGATFSPVSSGWISNNLSPTTGQMNWNLPANTGAFRLMLECRTPAGIVTSRLSDYLNLTSWSVFAGDPGSLRENVSAQAAILTDSNTVPRMSLASDIAGNIFIRRDSAIMRVEYKTGMVTRFAGQQGSSTICSMQPGQDPLTAQLGDTIHIFGTNPSGDALILAACNKIWLLNTFTRALSILNSTIPSSIQFNNMKGANLGFLSRKKNLFYFSNGQLFKLNLSLPEQQPVPIAGVAGTCSTTAPSEGSRALDFPLTGRIQTAPNTCDFWGESYTFANPDESKVWVGCFTGNSGYACKNYVRYDFDPQQNTYVVGVSDTGIPPSGDWSFCAPSILSTRVYCSGRWRASERMSFDTLTGTFLKTSLGSGNFVWYAPSSTGMVSFASNNLLRSHLEKADGTIQDVVIGGKDIETFGNGGRISEVAFSGVNDITYSPARSQLLVLTSSVGRRFDLNANLALNGTFDKTWKWRTTLNAAGTKLLTWFQCGASFNYLYDYDGSVFSDASVRIQNQNTCGYDLGNTAYPAIDGTLANTPVTWPYNNQNVNYNRRALAHSNGKVYFFALGTDNKNALIYSSANNVLNIVAGQRDASSGYSASNHGQLAVGALLSDVRVIFEIPAGKPFEGDLLLVDSNRLRRVSVTTEASSPKIYDVVALTLATEFVAAGVSTSGGDFMDAVYDFSSETNNTLGTGSFYYAWKSTRVSKFKANTNLTAASDTAYNFNGTSLAGNNTRLALTPAGLLVTQPNKARVLSVAP